MKRVLGWLGMAAILVGLPALLILTWGIGAPTLSWQALFVPDDGRLFLTLLKFVGWAAWVVLAASLVLELAGALRARPVPRLRWLGWAQSLSHWLVALSLGAAITSANVVPAFASSMETVTVQAGESLWSIAERELGDGERYDELFALNQGREQVTGHAITDADMIWPGDKLVLPDQAGESATADSTQAQSAEDEIDVRLEIRYPQDAVRPYSVPADKHAEAGIGAEGQGGERPSDVPAATTLSVSEDQVPSWLIAGLSGAGGLLAGGLFIELGAARRIQARFRRPTRALKPLPRIAAPFAKTISRVGRGNAKRLKACDNALRALEELALPQLLQAELGEDTLVLHFNEPASLPEPWHKIEPARWERKLAGVAKSENPAPWPLLVTVGEDSRKGLRLVNLGAFSSVATSGDLDRRQDFIRAAVLELGHSPWAGMVEIVTDLPWLGEVGQNADPAETATGALPRVRFIAASELAALGEAENEPDAPMRLFVLAKPLKTGSPTLALDGPGEISVDIDARGVAAVPDLGILATANGLTDVEAARIAVLAAASEDNQDAPMPEYSDAPEPWRRLIDRAGAVRAEYAKERGSILSRKLEAVTMLPSSKELETTANLEEDLQALAPEIAVTVRDRAIASDPDLDADLAAWKADYCDRPRLTVLDGLKVRVGRTGILSADLVRRKAYFTEVVAYLAANPEGVTLVEFADAFGISDQRVRVVASIVRGWLGKDTNGKQYFPPADNNPAQAERGQNVYCLPGILSDADLFRRLRLRAQAKGEEGFDDLVRALRLVKQAPYQRVREDGGEWVEDLPDDMYLRAAICDTAHLVATRRLVEGDFGGAREAVRIAQLVEPDDGAAEADLVSVLRHEGNQAQAQAAARRMLRWSPDDVPVSPPERLRRLAA
ncbi:MAG: LysM peptidoglycan-binding domain-containing protein [Propionibacteriaceae bacterium]|nr:LysM peptidoglycan-binding domain-containing protein [Propionibacteriaceae bacterium]